MAIDMKEIIAEGARNLLMGKKVKKLTVKDIAEECNITRQTFYYHFEDIPDMIRWIMENEFDKMVQEMLARDDPEDSVYYLLTVALNIQPHLERGMQSNYGEEFEKIVGEFIHHFSRRLMDEKGMFKNYSEKDRELIVRYHCWAVVGIVRGWTKEDTKNMEEVVHMLYALLMGEVRPY